MPFPLKISFFGGNERQTPASTGRSRSSSRVITPACTRTCSSKAARCCGARGVTAHIAHSIKTSNLNYLLNTSCPLYMLYDLQGNDIWYAWAWDEALRIEKEKPGWRKQKTVTLQFRKKLTEQSVQEVHQRIRTETTIARGNPCISAGQMPTTQPPCSTMRQTLQDAEPDPGKSRTCCDHA